MNNLQILTKIDIKVIRAGYAPNSRGHTVQTRREGDKSQDQELHKAFSTFCYLCRYIYKTLSKLFI